ncbi:MAG: SufE family protein [Saprospiraceae bacterium]|nr:SufE family protein [Saprospiraceae bacterium]
MGIRENELEVIDEFEMFDDWMDKYNYIIDLGKHSPVIDESLKTKENLVYGCTSQVWLYYEIRDGKLFFSGDSDAFIPKGILSIILRIYSGNIAKDIADHVPVFLDRTGLLSHLTPNRANGLASIIERVKSIAKQNL